MGLGLAEACEILRLHMAQQLSAYQLRIEKLFDGAGLKKYPKN